MTHEDHGVLKYKAGAFCPLCQPFCRPLQLWYSLFTLEQIQVGLMAGGSVTRHPQSLCWSQTALPNPGSINGKPGRGWMLQTATTVNPCRFQKQEPDKEQSRWGSSLHNQVYKLINYCHCCNKLVTEMRTSWCYRKPAVILDMLSSNTY